jgi:hypothetical protein
MSASMDSGNRNRNFNAAAAAGSVRAIAKWRAAPGEDENYVYAIVL